MSDSTTPNEDSQKNLVIIIAGPTGVGKSDVAASLCLQQDGIIVSADSVQAYKGVQIGANKPTAEEMQQTPHLLVDLVDNVDVGEHEYNAAEWRRDAIYCIEKLLRLKQHDSGIELPEEELARRQSISNTIQQAQVNKGFPPEKPLLPLIVGGTMMYLQWLVYGQPDAMRPTKEAVDKAVEEITSFQSQSDWDGAVQRVESMGPTFAARIQILEGHDWYRLRRILEVAYTVLDNKDVSVETVYSGEREGGLQDLLNVDVRCFFLCPNDRMNHTAVVDRRCEEMIRRGLLQETSELYQNNALPDMAARAIGYRQTLDYLTRKDFQPNDTAAFEAYLHEFTTSTRRYAKKQMQWFRKDGNFLFVPVKLADPKESRVKAATATIWEKCCLSSRDYEQELVSESSQSTQTRKTNEEQGPGMKFYQYKSHSLRSGTSEFERALKQADECTRQVQEAQVSLHKSKKLKSINH